MNWGWLLLVAAVAVTTSPDPTLDFVNDRAVKGMFVDLLKRSGVGVLQTETAAFLVADSSSGYRCLAWPYVRAERMQSHKGAAPAFTVAILHTHPQSLYRPSRHDLATARLVGVPVLVLTPLNIYAAMPDGRSVPVVRQRFWADQNRCRCDSSGPPPTRQAATEAPPAPVESSRGKASQGPTTVEPLRSQPMETGISIGPEIGIRPPHE